MRRLRASRPSGRHNAIAPMLDPACRNQFASAGQAGELRAGSAVLSCHPAGAGSAQSDSYRPVVPLLVLGHHGAGTAQATLRIERIAV